MVWVGNMPARLAGAWGLHHLRLAVIGTGGAPQLMLQYLPAVSDDLFSRLDAQAPGQLLVWRRSLGSATSGSAFERWSPEW